MSILKDLQENKGTVSSKLGKELAEKVLKGNKSILEEAVKPCTADNNFLKYSR